MPIDTPPTAKSTGEMSIMRVRSTASPCSSCSRPVSSPRPGASSGTISPATRKATTANAAVATSTRLSTELASRHPARPPPGEGGEKAAPGRPPRQQLEDEVGQAEGDPVGVQLRPRAERLGDDHAAQQAEEAAAPEPGGDDQRSEE